MNSVESSSLAEVRICLPSTVRNGVMNLGYTRRNFMSGFSGLFGIALGYELDDRGSRV
jgi:hypothetical protein